MTILIPTSRYTYLWDTGETVPDLENIPPGEYTLTVTDSLGCETAFTFAVDFGTASGEVAGGAVSVLAVPNPSPVSGAVQLRFESGERTWLTVQLVDVAGRRLWSRDVNIPVGSSSLDFRAPDVAGMYWLVLRDGSGRRSALKWVVAG